MVLMYLRAFSRFVILLIAFSGFSVSTANALSVSYYGALDEINDIPYFDSSLGVLDRIALDFQINHTHFVSGWLLSGEQPYHVTMNSDIAICWFKACFHQVPTGQLEFIGVSGPLVTAMQDGELIELSPFFESKDSQVASSVQSEHPIDLETFSGSGVYGFFFDFSESGPTSCDTFTTGFVGLDCGGGPVSGTYAVTYDYTLAAVPIPATLFLFGSALIGLVGFSNRKKAA